MPDPGASQEIDDLFTRLMAYRTQQLVDGEITIGDWQLAMRTDIRRAHALQLIAGAGGDASKIDPNDWLKLGSVMRSQNKYLEQFAHDVAAGDLSPAQIEARANLYIGAAHTTYSKQATGHVKLPTYPGEQQCMGNCLCQWIDNGDGSWTWDRTNEKGTSCDDCIHNAEIYNPYWPDANEAEAA